MYLILRQSLDFSSFEQHMCCLYSIIIYRKVHKIRKRRVTRPQLSTQPSVKCAVAVTLKGNPKWSHSSFSIEGQPKIHQPKTHKTPQVFVLSKFPGQTSSKKLLHYLLLGACHLRTLVLKAHFRGPDSTPD